jgi:hypothetical protein
MSKQIDQLITDALAIEAEDAKEAGALGYMARGLVQATIPHSATSDAIFIRKNGNYTFSITNALGKLPYGPTPRLLLAWLATEAVTTQSPDLELGNNLSSFMRELGMVPTGGRWGNITRLKEQTKRLFGSSVHAHYSAKNEKTGKMETGLGLKNILIADEANLWWEPKTTEQSTLFTSTVTLSEKFYKEIIENPVPVDMRALKALRTSSMALDIYCWLTYRMSYLKKPTNIPWEGLQAQFGSGYPNDSQGTRNFKKKFLLQLKKVLVVYPEARVGEGVSGLLVRPSKTHIPKL